MSELSGAPRKKQRGHVIVYSLAMLIVMTLTVGYVFNANQIANNKTRLQNTADAAAYSVAAVEARDLNFKAYTNRAMVANQVALAQSVSLVSWSRFAGRYARNIGRLLSLIPYAGPILNRAGEAIHQAMEVMQEALEYVITGLNEVERALSFAQDAHHFGTLALANSTLSDVVEKNDSSVDTSLSFESVVFLESLREGHLNFTHRYTPRNASRASRSSGYRRYAEDKARMDEFRSVTLQSRDGFSANRSYEVFSANLYFFRVSLRKAGGTEMLAPDRSFRHRNAPYYKWAAMDTLSFHESTRDFGLFGGWNSWDEILPVGWGAAQTGNEGVTRYSLNRGENFGSTWEENPVASAFALRDRSEGNSGNFNGLRPFYDLRQEGLLMKAPGVTLLLTKPHSEEGAKTLESTPLGEQSERLNLEEKGGMLNDRLAAVSRAAPYFSRSTDISAFSRNDELREYGNAYNPFWQPRLEPLRRRDQILSLAASL